MAFTLKWYAGNINTVSSLEKLQEKKGKLEKLCEQTVIATNKHIMFPLKAGIVIKMSKKGRNCYKNVEK